MHLLYDHPLGLSSGFFGPFSEETFAAYRDNGIGYMEISCGQMDQCDALDLDSAAKWADQYGVMLWSFHLPFAPFERVDPSSTNEEKRLFTVAKFCEYIDRGVRAGIRIFVVHPSAEPIEDAERPARLERARRSLAFIAEYAGERGAVIAVEDLPRTCIGRDSDDIRSILEVDERLMIAFDTNHLLKETNEHFVKELGKRIITTHISDYDMIDECHMLPGEGKIKWPKLLSVLEKNGYLGPLLYEVSRGGGRRFSRRDRMELTDVVANHRCLNAGRKPKNRDMGVRFDLNGK